MSDTSKPFQIPGVRIYNQEPAWLVHVRCCRIWTIALGSKPAACGLCGATEYKPITQAEADEYEQSRAAD